KLRVLLRLTQRHRQLLQHLLRPASITEAVGVAGSTQRRRRPTTSSPGRMRRPFLAQPTASNPARWWCCSLTGTEVIRRLRGVIRTGLPVKSANLRNLRMKTARCLGCGPGAALRTCDFSSLLKGVCRCRLPNRQCVRRPQNCPRLPVSAPA
ncbi:MAG: hypothetical protein MZV64_73620, partial [Ignavibacteriales bacterium]|nr:hypothetical protein [Ignavibacteriales bacterium]